YSLVYTLQHFSPTYLYTLSLHDALPISYFGTRDLPKLLKTLKADYKHELVGERLLTTPSHYAYLKISEGCDRPCSFCAIPIMRGDRKSTRLNSSHLGISYAVFCLKKKK